MPNAWDYALALLFAVLWPLYTFFIEWPKHVKRVQAGEPDARVKIYRRTFIQEWAITAAIVTLTIVFHRSLADALWLRAPLGWRLPVGIALPLTYAILLIAQVPAIAKNPGKRARLRERIKDLSPLVPANPVEWGWFRPLAVTAGICEEVMFRGYLVWMLTPWLGVWGAAAVSATIFGLGHSYQGIKFAPRAFAAGLGLQAIALLTGSIVPGIVLHALIDLGSGYVTYLAMTTPTPAEATAAA
jgi:membrane protease YdiL (CAAX protease family)